MEKISFKYCPVCGGELNFGTARFPSPYSLIDLIAAEAQFYSDKTAEAYEKHPIKKLFQMNDKSFSVRWGNKGNPAGFCEKCNRIFVEFKATD